MHNVSAPRLTLEQYYSTSRLQKLTTSDSLEWNNARLEIAKHEAIPDLVYSPFLDDDVLAFLLDGSALMNMHISGGILRRKRIGPALCSFCHGKRYMARNQTGTRHGSMERCNSTGEYL